MPDIVIPGEETRWSPNHDEGRAEPPRLIVIHATRGNAATLAQEYLGTINFCSGPNSNKSSCPHVVVGPTRACRMVHDKDRAWHAGYLNPDSLGIEVAQPRTLPPFTDTEYDLTAQIVAGWCHAFAIPLIRVLDENLRGIIGHEDTAQGKANGKTDPGAKWAWIPFLALAATYLANGNAPRPFDPWLGIGSGLAAFGKAHPEWGTPSPRALAPHYFDADHDEIVKLSSGDWLIWRHYTSHPVHVPAW